MKGSFTVLVPSMLEPAVPGASCSCACRAGCLVGELLPLDEGPVEAVGRSEEAADEFELESMACGMIMDCGRGVVLCSRLFSLDFAGNCLVEVTTLVTLGIGIATDVSYGIDRVGTSNPSPK